MTFTSSSALATVIRDPRGIELEDWGSLPEGTGESMRTAGKVLWKGDGIMEVGLWECAPGPSRWLFETNESITVFAGLMIVAEDGGQEYEISAGDTALFPKGWSGTWDIQEAIFKFYTVF